MMSKEGERPGWTNAPKGRRIKRRQARARGGQAAVHSCRSVCVRVVIVTHIRMCCSYFAVPVSFRYSVIPPRTVGSAGTVEMA